MDELKITQIVSDLQSTVTGLEKNFDYFKNNYYSANQKLSREYSIKQLAIQLLNSPLWDDKKPETPKLRIMAAIDMAIFFEENIAIKVK